MIYLMRYCLFVSASSASNGRAEAELISNHNLKRREAVDIAQWICLQLPS